MGSEVVLKTCGPKKWVVQPKGFPTIPHTTVNRHFFIKMLFFLCRGCPLGSVSVLKTCGPKKWVAQPNGIPTIALKTVNRPFFNRHSFSSAGDAL